MFNLTLQKWLLILAGAVLLLTAVTGVLGYSLYLEHQRSEALEARLENFEQDNKALQVENFRIIDSLKTEKAKGHSRILSRDQKIDDLLIYVDSILNIPPNEANIDTMRDLDSIAYLFSKYYPNKSGAGEGSY